LAEVEARRGNLDGALGLIEDTLGQVRENQVWVSDLHTRRAALLTARGLAQHAAAADALRTAIGVAESQGAVFFARRAAAALARIEPAAAPVATGQPSNLSSRERELVGLVGRGLTDKEIATALVISLATVRSHLDRIRDKTGRRRRPELMRLADELGLTRG
jgi:DNA-binding NarL/FixJ family response regulator